MIRVAFSGGDCAGKSTVFGSLPHKIGQKIYFVPEVPTNVMGTVLPRLGQDIRVTPEVLQMFQVGIRPLQLCAELMAKEVLIQEYALARSKRAIVFDRALPDYVAYEANGWPAIETQLGISREQIFGMYDKVFFFDSLALRNPELFTQLMGSNPNRTPRTITDAVELNSRLAHIWKDHPGFELVDFSNGVDGASRQVASYFQSIFGNEIERKFQLAGEPDWKVFRTVLPVDQTQCYWAITPKGEYRWRRSCPKGLEVEYSATIKGRGTLMRGEQEQPDWPPNGAFEQFLDLNAYVGHVIEKTRHISVPTDGDWVYEIDHYRRPEENWIVEITFDTLEQAERFVRPPWMAEAIDVTDELGYKASQVALNGKFPVRTT